MKKEIHVFDKPENVRRLLRIFFAILAVLLAADLLMHLHGHFAWESAHLFFAAYGFVSCVIVIYISKALRFFLKRSEDYYESENEGSRVNQL